MGEKLILKDNNFIKGWEKLLLETEKNPKLQQAFIKDPTKMLSEFLFDKSDQLSLDQIDKSNLLLFSILNNKNFMDWAKKYEETTLKKLANPNEISTEELSEIYEETSEAMIKYADKELLRTMFQIDPEQIEIIVKKHPKVKRVDATPISYVAVVLVVVVVAVAVIVVMADVAKHDVFSRSSLQKLSKEMVSQLEMESKRLGSKKIQRFKNKKIKRIIKKDDLDK